jgi:predicted nucleotidyltransferase
VLQTNFYHLEKENPIVSSLPDRVTSYLDDIIRLLERKLGRQTVVAGIIFGSHIRDAGSKPISDCDVLVVVKDEVPRARITAAQPFLRALEIKHGFARYHSGLVDGVLRVVESTTGMFVSHFVCREVDLRRRDFARIFSTNKFVTLALAPWKIVMGSVGNNSWSFYGTDLRGFLRDTRPGPIQIVKSLLMNYCLSIGNLIIYPLRKTNFKYTLEAVKWAVSAAGFYLFGNGNNIGKLVPIFANLGVSPRFLEQFLHDRDHPRRNPKFALKAPWVITKLHTLALHLKKLPA